MNDFYLIKWPDGSVTMMNACDIMYLEIRLSELSKGDTKDCIIHKIIPDEDEEIIIDFVANNNDVKAKANPEWKIWGGKLKKIKLLSIKKYFDAMKKI
jgi:hypothetical protein